MADEEEQGGEDPDAADKAAVKAFLDVLNRMGMEGVLQKGHEALLRLLVAKTAAGTASHQEMAILRNMLRDNGMVLSKVIEGSSYTPTALPGTLDDIPELEPPSYQQ